MAKKSANRDTGPDADAAHWRMVADTVTPLRRRRRSPAIDRGAAAPAPPPPAPPPEAGPGKEAAVEPPPPIRQAPAPADLDRPGYGGISRADARRIRSGKSGIHDRIDLHGMTLDQAGRSLRQFIETAAGRGDRTVLVVTGKGRGGTGVIRQHLPQWLRQPPLGGLVLAYCRAQPRDGGSGAYYIRLRGR